MGHRQGRSGMSTGASQHGFLYDPEAEVSVRGSERRVGPTSV